LKDERRETQGPLDINEQYIDSGVDAFEQPYHTFGEVPDNKDELPEHLNDLEIESDIDQKKKPKD
jgi:hypothetical protein